MAESRVTQVPAEVLSTATEERVTQVTVEVFTTATDGRVTHIPIEVLSNASEARITQVPIEVLYIIFFPDEDYYWTKPVDNEMKFARPVVGDEDTLVRSICRCVAVPGMSVCMHGNPMTYFDCVSGIPPLFASPLTGVEIPCEN